ncbi:IclR family transcriptional regulator [Yinghuangia soli]|uniref:Glycerol operon regulatory protein n=1 Tax=Yinghuangia soli TaxID=2908204 RepID=A0AA41U371_9ACTN|nr:IclR family transcriptional regulator [Yinghuangia soli]MCF2531510.1 IclR family transcriptional regulator [Yinghuangia soli]
MPADGGSRAAAAPGDAAASASQTVAVVERAADVLLHFCDARRGDLGITEIADAMGLSKAAVHRLLGSLRSRGLVEIDPDTRRYALGPAAARVGLSYLARLDVRAVALPELKVLSEATGETATLSVRSGDSRLYIDQVTPDREVIMSVSLGAPYPLNVGASSKALLAFLPEARDARELARLVRSSRSVHPPRSPRTGTPSADTGMDDTLANGASLRRLANELAAIRARGWSRSAGERQPGAGSVAAPVFDHRAAPVAVVSVCGPADRFASVVGQCLEQLLDATGRLSRRLGAPAHCMPPTR